MSIEGMRPGDIGPIYTETVMGRFPVEPWNTWTNILFLFLIIYLIWRTSLNFKRYPLVVFGLPVLIVGFVGGTVFHATRSATFWLRMDYIPIFILALGAAFYFWQELLHGAVRGAIAILTIYLLIRLSWLFGEMPISLRIGLGYTAVAFSLIVPAFLLCARENWHGARWLLGAGLSFVVAITFRTIDTGIGAQLFPMGTHFLWHVFGATSAYLMFEFILRRYDRKREHTIPA